MKSFKYKLTSLLLALGMIFFTSCQIEEIENPNGPSFESLEDGATLADLRLLGSGLEAILRVDMEFYFQTVSIIGREYWDLNGSDPRYTGELLGAGGSQLDNNGFLTTRSFAARYRAVKDANLLITATLNSNAGLTMEQENAILGYAKTMQAYSLLLVANRQFNNGIRLDVLDPDDLGSFTSNHLESLQGISDLLDEAAALLTNGGFEFIFELSSGFEGFDTPATFRQFNRALSARVKLYMGDKGGSLSSIAGSFFNINGNIQTGPKHVFGGAIGNDQINPLFYIPDQDLYTVHPDFLADAEAGDLRVTAKTQPYDPNVEGLPPTLDDLFGDTQVNLFDANTDPFPIIRNEELILIYAEAQIGSNINEVLAAINRVRNAAGLGNYLGATDDATMLSEVLHQRRYSFFGEGHRWIDMRRTGKLAQINIDRPGDQVFEQFPRPLLEE